MSLFNIHKILLVKTRVMVNREQIKFIYYCVLNIIIELMSPINYVLVQLGNYFNVPLRLKHIILLKKKQ